MLHSDTESDNSEIDEPINNDFSVNYEENENNIIVTYNCNIYILFMVLIFFAMIILITIIYLMFTLDQF